MSRGILKIEKPVYILSSASVVGKKERENALGELFDLGGDDKFGKDSWEKSEAEMQRLSMSLALKKASLDKDSIDIMFAGDLINQCISSSFGLADYSRPFFGLFGACSTCAEGMIMASVYSSTVAERCTATTSSHYCSAERQFRFPLEYGGQRPPTAQWTVTGAASFVFSSRREDLALIEGEFIPRVRDAMTGTIVDRGISDPANMGAAMAPSAADTLEKYLCASNAEKYPDLVVTGDLGREGSGILLDLLSSRGIDISSIHTDCGNMIYSGTKDDTHAGGSGCGCSAVVMSADILENMRTGEIKDVLFIGTGALMNTMSVNQKQNIPGIAHLVHITAEKRME